jgi:hypothetical protein
MLCVKVDKVLVMVLWLHSFFVEAHPRTSAVHVAFVFGGSARSLVYPIVHKTIHHNLINSFCSKANACVPHVFARVSLSDNTHQQSGYDAKGKFAEADVSLKSSIGKLSYWRSCII